MTTNGARSWCFTLNNPSLEALDYLEAIKTNYSTLVRYIVFQLEEGENGTRHFQGYVELNRAQRLSYMKKIDPNAHWEKRMGSREQARMYAMKEDTRISGPFEYGTFEAGGQGRRNDVKEFIDSVRSGKRKRELIDDYPLIMMKHPKFYEAIKQEEMPIRENDLIVRLNYGHTRTGKTRYCKENFPNHWELPITNGTLWFDGEDMHEVCLLDDFCGKKSKWTLDNLLKILDIYPRRVPFKGGFTWWMPNIIIITSNLHPRDWYEWAGREEQYNALAARITEIWFYKRIKIEESISNAEDAEENEIENLVGAHRIEIEQVNNDDFFENYWNYQL